MLRYLLNFWLSSIVMMFAAGATIADVGTGGAGDGSTGSDGDAGGTGGDGASSDDFGANGSGDDDAGTAAGDGADGSGEGDQDGTDGDRSAAAQSTDTKGFTPEDKKLLNLAQKAGPKEAQRVRQLLFAEKRLNKIVPGGVKAVAELVRTVEEFGGVEGMQQLQADLASRTESDELFNRSDPRWVENGFQQNPEAALKLFAHTLSYVAEHHAEDYNHLAAGILLKQLSDRQAGLPVHALHLFLTTSAILKDSPEAKQLAAQLAKFYNNIDDLAAKVPEKKVDAQQKALTDRAAAVEKQEMDVRYKQVNTEIFPVMKGDVVKNLRDEMKRDGLDLDKLSQDYPAEWRNMLNEIHRQIMAAVRKDSRFLDNYGKRVKANELQRAVELINQKHAAVIPDVVRAVRATYGVFRGKKAGSGNGNQNRGGNNAGNTGNANQGWTRVSAKPANHLIDYSKSPMSMTLDGKYILKDGRKVQVVY